jgi:hypothetical protein
MKIASLTKLAGGLIVALALGAANMAKADPIQGTINFDGVATLNGSANGIGTAATAFSTITNVIVAPGSQSGDYSTVPDGYSPVTFKTFSFDAAGVTPLWTFVFDGLTYSFDATSVSVIANVPADSITLYGNGEASITGPGSPFTQSFGTWDMTVSGNGATNFTFGDANTVPDKGTTGLLIGLGIAGVGLGVVAQRRRKLSKS